MPRVVPIVHRAPPPPLEEVLAEPVPPGGGLGLMSSTSIKNASLAPHITHSHKRRTHIPSSNGSSSASKLANGHSNAAKASNSSSDKHFSLFDQIQELLLTEVEFVEKLASEGLEMRTIAGDGNCMFRSVADQVYGDEEMHEKVRACCLDYMEQEKDFFSEFVSIDFSKYVSEKRKLRVYGDHLELQAMAELYNRPVEIRIPGKKMMRICEVENDSTEAHPIRLSYHNNNHYNSIRDPNDTRIGVGLGLPANQAPETDKTLVEAALQQSLKTEAETQLLETAKLESVQQALDEQQLQQHALEESEQMHIEQQFWNREYELALDGQEIDEDFQDHDEDAEMEAAIRLSLLEAEQAASGSEKKDENNKPDS